MIPSLEVIVACIKNQLSNVGFANLHVMFVLLSSIWTGSQLDIHFIQIASIGPVSIKNS